jgi:hypothetical protein
MNSKDIFHECFRQEIADLPIWFHSHRFVHQSSEIQFALSFPSELSDEAYSIERLLNMMKDEILEVATGTQATDLAEFSIHHITTTQSALGDVFDSSYLKENQIDSLSDLYHDLLWEWAVKR